MVSTFLVISVLFFFVSCEQNCQQYGASSQESQVTCPTPTGENSGTDTSGDVIEADAQMFEGRVHFTNFQDDEEEKVVEAIEIIKKIKTSEFKNRVLNFTFNGKKQFNDNNGLSNEEIYQLLISGKEELEPVVDSEMDLELELYYTWKNTVGYTTPGEMTIYLNRKFFTNFNSLQVAGNLFHEWVHKLGFDHASTYSVERDSSVPYALGYIIEELGKK
jgi:hypothetical protein